MFLAILTVARIVISTTWKKGLYDGKIISDRDLILFFKHQFTVKIRYDRKHLDRKTLNKKWLHVATLIVRKGAIPIPPLTAHGRDGLGLSRTLARLVIVTLSPFIPQLVEHCVSRYCHLVYSNQEAPTLFIFMPNAILDSHSNHSYYQSLVDSPSLDLILSIFRVVLFPS